MIIYNVQTNETVSQLVIELIDDSIYVEPNAISYILGTISFDEANNNFIEMLKTKVIGKKFIKPKLCGTGKIYLHATLGAYHKFTIEDNQELFISNSAFIACRDSVKLIPKIDISIKKFLSGTPIINMLAKGHGHVMVLMAGPVHEITLDDNKFMVFNENEQIAGYSTKLHLTRELSKISWGIKQRMISVFRGTGNIYFTPIPNKDSKPK